MKPIVAHCVYKIIQVVVAICVGMFFWTLAQQSNAVSQLLTPMTKPLSPKACSLIQEPVYPAPSIEAEELVEKACAFIQQQPRAIEYMHKNQHNKWYAGQFTVLVIDAKSDVVVASPGRKSLRGMYLGDIGITLDGKSLLTIANNIKKFTTGVWQSFYWRVPGTRDVALLHSYGKVAVGNRRYVVLSGYFDAEGRCSQNQK